MRSTLALAAALVVAVPAMGVAATCPDMAAPSIIAPASAEALKCLSTITKGASGFVKSKLGTESKCAGKKDPTACPNAKDDAKIQKAAAKAMGKIASACGTDSVQAGLASIYGDLTDADQIGSCVMSQHNATANVMSGWITGAPVAESDGARAGCEKAVSKNGAKFAASALKAINGCIDGQLKAGNAADLGPVCVGSWSGGTYTAASDLKAADKIAKAMAKTADGIDKACGALSNTDVSRLYVCQQTTTVGDLDECAICNDWSGIVDILNQQYNEAGTFVANGAGAFQDAVDAAAPGEKLLFQSGDYQEVVTVSTDDLQLVGCGAATNDRPNLIPPLLGGPFPNGVLAANTDGLLFQSLQVTGWDENGIFVTDADGVTFRDIEGDGDLISTYADFPVASNNVVVEGSHVTAVTDAGIYVGQSTNIVVRFNRVDNNVAGIEIENSGNADVYGNHAIDNTGGILVFKLPGPALQISLDHDIHHNVSVRNNTPNFGAPGSTVALIPDGTGMFIISNDTSNFRHNFIADNNSFGMAMIDQEGINALVPGPGPFDPTSVDQTTNGNEIFFNTFRDNGTDPDDDGDNQTQGLGGNIVFFLGDDTNHDNCFGGQGVNTSAGPAGFVFLTPSDCL